MMTAKGRAVSEDHEAPAISRRFFWSVVAVSLLIATVKRLSVIAPAGFPIGEGGLFVLFSEAILNNGFAMPGHVVWSGVTLPFAYSPAGFYLAAAIAKVTGDLLGVYYWLPIALNLLAVPAFCFLAAQLTKDRIVFLCASILYVQLPDSFIWQITAAGVPRSLGAIFSLLAVALALRISETHSKRELLLCGLSISLAILSHMEWGLYAAIGVTLAFFARNTGWKVSLLLTAGAGLIAAAGITPWLAAVLSQHGLDPFLSSSSASQWNIGGFVAGTVSGSLFGLIVWPAILGAFLTLSRGNWLLVAWALSTLLLTPRMGASAGLAIPASLLAGYGFKAVGDWLAATIRSTNGVFLIRFRRLATASSFGISLPILCLLFGYSIALASPLRFYRHPPLIVDQVDRPSRQAMSWIARRTEPSSRFVVISSAEAWWADRVAEWFPFLARRGSLTTAQGLEWAGKGVFVAKLDEIKAFKSLQAAAPTMMPIFVRQRYCRADYVAVFAPPGAPERQSFGGSGFRAVFENDGAAVFGMPSCTGVS